MDKKLQVEITRSDRDHAKLYYEHMRNEMLIHIQRRRFLDTSAIGLLGTVALAVTTQFSALREMGLYALTLFMILEGILILLGTRHFVTQRKIVAHAQYVRMMEDEFTPEGVHGTPSPQQFLESTPKGVADGLREPKLASSFWIFVYTIPVLIAALIVFVPSPNQGSSDVARPNWEQKSEPQ